MFRKLALHGHSTKLKKPAKWLAAADRNDDFQSVAIGQQVLVKLPARDDFTIAFQSDALAAQLYLFEQCGNANGHVEMTRFTVD